jgi:hypothetical protein
LDYGVVQDSYEVRHQTVRGASRCYGHIIGQQLNLIRNPDHANEQVGLLASSDHSWYGREDVAVKSGVRFRARRIYLNVAAESANFETALHRHREH